MRNAQIGEQEVVVYWRNLEGDIMLAPDTRMKPFRGWFRFECKTAAEIESFSRIFAAQEHNKFKKLKIEEHLRSMAQREKLKANCRLRLAKGCISPTDELATRLTLESLEKKDERLYRFLTEQPDLSRGCLMIEKYDSAKVASFTQSKQRGLRDDEVNVIAKLAETTA
jgi:hypothetical protein